MKGTAVRSGGLTHARHDQRTEDAREAFRDRLLSHMQTRTAAEWMAMFVADGGIVAHQYQTTHQALDAAFKRAAGLAGGLS